MERKRIDCYEIVEELGRGGMGVVFKAFEESLNRHVAIKMLGDQLTPDESLAARFMREARAVADLNHPNLVQVFRVDRHEGQPYFVMEYVEGESLKELIQRERQIPTARAFRILNEVGGGLSAAHEKGVVHRDIKPENIMLTRYGGVKVVDFGIARVEEPGTRLTTTGMGLGTPNYLSPEVLLTQEVDQRSDIFSLGVVLFEMLTGDVPFRSESPFEMMTKVVEARIPDIKALNPNVDDGARMILAKMIAKRPKQRYQSCRELTGDVEDYLAGRVPRWASASPVTDAIEEPASFGADPDAPTAAFGDGGDATVVDPRTPAVQGDGARGEDGDGPATEAVTPAPPKPGLTPARLALGLVAFLAVGGIALASTWYWLARDGSPAGSLATADGGAPQAGAELADSLDRPEADAAVSSADAPPDRRDADLANPLVTGLSRMFDGADTDAPGGLEPTPGSDPAGGTAVRGADGFDAPAVAGTDGSGARPPVADGRTGAPEPEAASVVADADAVAGTRATPRPETSGEVESSGDPGYGDETLATAAEPVARGGMPETPRVVVVAVGDPAVAGVVARLARARVERAGFEVLDEALIEDLAYAETLPGFMRAAFDGGGDVLVFVDVVATGERDLEYYGRRQRQRLGRVEMRVVDLHRRDNIGTVFGEPIEYVPLTAEREAEQSAAPLVREVMARLRSLRTDGNA